MNIHHIGYLVKKVRKHRRHLKRLDILQRANGRMTKSARWTSCFAKDGYRIELVSPYAPDSVVSGLIRTYKNAPYHLCYEAENFEKELAELEGNGYIRIDEPTPAPAIGGRRVVFLMHPAAGMLELLEEK